MVNTNQSVSPYAHHCVPLIVAFPLLRQLYGSICRIRDGKGLGQLGFALDKTHKVALDMCLGSMALSLACINAGSGDLDCMRTIRELRWKTEDVTYGTHMAFSMALGKVNRI